MIHKTILLAALLLGACSTQATTHSESASAADSFEWTTSMLRKLDPDLRHQVSDGDSQRIAIKVFFHDDPSDEELSGLLLSRVGNQVIGRVELATLHSIASRADVDHIESLTDVGY